MSEVAAGVHFVEGPASNWVVLIGVDDVALIDSGYPKDLPLVVESIQRAGGRVDDLTTIAVTHGHSDHIGSAAALVDRTGARVLGSTDELPNIRRTELHQIGVGDILAVLWKPLIARWTVHAVRAGGLGDVGVASAAGLPASEAGPDALRLAGHRVLPVLVPGHTPGHTAYLLPDARALVTGDAVISGHPTTRELGPQLLAPMWHSDPALAERSLAALAELSADTVLPGHGPLLRITPPVLVESALRRDGD